MDELKKLKASLAGQGDSDSEEKLKELLSTGNAILFTGAGFSVECINIIDKKPPSASELSVLIGAAIVDELKDGLDEEEIKEISDNQNLMFTSDFYINNISNKSKLIELLKHNFTIKKPTNAQVEICKLKWRRIYTTNYDNAIELALGEAGKSVTSLDLTDAPNKYRDAADICLHINGKVDKIVADDFESRIKLSTSSYLSAEQFLESSWYTQFKKDLENSSAIVFVGYSMYDIDVKKILFANKHLIDKTFFITKTDSNFESVYNLKKYGSVLKIGTELFSRIVSQCIESSNQDNVLDMIYSMEKYEVNDNIESMEIRDLDINNFLLFGNVSDGYIDTVLLNPEIKNKFIFRENIELIANQLAQGSNILITADLGNGKTITTKLLMAKLSRMGFDCFLHLKNSYDISNDLEVINKNNRKTIIFVDDYSNVINDVVSLIESDYSNIQIVLTTRYYGYESTKHKLSVLDMGRFKSHAIDNLKNQEVEQFVELVHNLGAWGDKAGLTTNQKLHGSDIDGRYQLSVLLITILQSPFIKSKIDEIASGIFKNKKYKDTVFTMLLLDVMGQPSDRAIVSDLSRSQEIYSNNFISNDGVSTIFKIERGVISSKSSTFSIFMLNNNFEPTYIANKLLELVGYLDLLPENSKDENYDLMKKSLLRFSLVEKILPKKRTEIKYYYEKLKEKVAWLTNDPHYWVQYAMAMIPFKDYSSAQTFINSAYSLAHNKNKGYHTNNIDTQQARLYLLKCLEASVQDAFTLFKSADDLFKVIPNDIYKYRQITRYEEIFKKKYISFSKGDKVYFEHACKRLISEATKALESPLDFYSGDILIQRAQDAMRRVVAAIESQR